MYRVLRANLENRRLWVWIDRGLDIHLSVADKSSLLMHLRKSDHPHVHDLWKDARLYLYSLGYDSKKVRRTKLFDERYLARLTKSF